MFAVLKFILGCYIQVLVILGVTIVDARRTVLNSVFTEFIIRVWVLEFSCILVNCFSLVSVSCSVIFLISVFSLVVSLC